MHLATNDPLWIEVVISYPHLTPLLPDHAEGAADAPGMHERSGVVRGIGARVGVVGLIVVALVAWIGVTNAQECTSGTDAQGRPICHNQQPPESDDDSGAEEHDWYAEDVAKAITLYTTHPGAGSPGPSFPTGNPNSPSTFGANPNADLQDAVETVITAVTPDSGVDELADQGREEIAQRVDNGLRVVGEFVEEVVEDVVEAVVDVFTPDPDPEPRTPSYTDCMVHAELCQAEQQEAVDEFHRGANNRRR